MVVDDNDSLDIEKTIQVLTEKGYSVRSKDEETAFLDREIKGSHSKLFNLFDSEIETLTGFKKDQNEKSTDYLKRAFIEKVKPLSELQGKIKEYETKGIQSNELAQEYKKRVELLEQQVSEKERTYSEQLNQLKGEIFNSKYNTEVQTAVAKILPTLRGDLDDAVKNDIVFAKVSRFKQEFKAKEFEGMIVYVDFDGEVIRSKKDGKPMNASEILDDMFKDYIDKGRKMGGNGSGKGADGTSDAVNWQSVAKEKGFTSMSQVVEHLNQHFSKLGKDNFSKEYNDAYKEIRAALPSIR